MSTHQSSESAGAVAFPPAGFMRGSSAVEGIEVWQPITEQPPHEEVVSFRCPSCGAGIGYDLAKGGLACPFCGYQQRAVVQVSGRSAAEFEFTADTVARAAQGLGDERRAIECEQCGSVTAVPPDQIAGRCPFCTSARVIQRELPSDTLRPRAIIPFTVQPQACQGIVRDWLGSSWMTPPDLARLADQAAFTAIYLPFWTFDSAAAASWRAEVGHTVVTGSGKRRRVRTVWRWESGNVQQQFDDHFIPGTTKISAGLLARVGVFDPQGFVEYQPNLLAGMIAQAYDRSLDQAWAIAREGWRDRIRYACYGQASSGQIRNFSMDLDYANERWRYVLVPIYLAAYQREQRTFQVLVNGQTGQVAGQRPVDWMRVGLGCAAMIVPTILLALIAAVLTNQGLEDAAAMLVFVAVIAGLVGGFFAIQTVLAAMRLDDA